MIFPRHVILSKGAHSDPLEGHCAMEAAAFLAGEQHSDSPECVSPTIGAFIRSWNDTIPDDETRTRLLLPLVLRIVGTRGTKEQEIRRSYLALDWLIREWTPAWLELAGLDADAATLRQCAELRDIVTVTAARPALERARESADAARAAAGDAAGDAARAAARAAAGAAAWDAARAAAWDAAWDAVWAAAWDAARDAAWDAARAAAGAAARDAARDAAGERLAPTVASLQQSALRLIDRMVAVKPGDYDIDAPVRRVAAEAVTA